MTEKTTNRERWLGMGYRQFGDSGPMSLNVEKLSLLVGLNRSSFYHYFGDVSLFENQLFSLHVQRFQEIGKELEGCSSFLEMVKFILRCRAEMNFHRQLLIHEMKAKYRNCFKEAKHFTEQVAFDHWTTFARASTAKVTDGELSFYRVVRDYCLVHFEDMNEQRLLESLQDLKLLIHHERE